MKNTKSNRRGFLKSAATLPLLRFSPLLAPAVSSASTCTPGDYKSLVCVFFEGGADTFNFVLPSGQKYQDYLNVRGPLAVHDSADSGYAPGSPYLNANDSSIGSFGFNGLLPGFRDLYNQNKLAVVCNVGNLAAPTSKQQFQSGAHPLPETLFAHDAQQKLWQTAGNALAESFGWGGLILENKDTCNANANTSAAMSITHANTWLNSPVERYTSIQPSRQIPPLRGYDENISGVSSAVQAVLNNLKNTASGGERSVFEQSIANSIDNTISATQALNDVLIGPEFAVDMDYTSTNTLAAQLETVARLIKARESLNMGRQVFFVNLGGWDTHRNQNTVLERLLPQVNEALTQFQSAIDSLGKENSVTTFTATEFGRTLTASGDGTDHGWGGHAFVMGGSVDGGKIYGDFPDFSVDNNLDDADDGSGTFAGRIIPKIAVSQYGATLGDWMGLTSAEQNSVFPSLLTGSFSNSNLGFMV